MKSLNAVCDKCNERFDTKKAFQKHIDGHSQSGRAPLPWIENGHTQVGTRIDSIGEDSKEGLEFILHPVAIVPRHEDAAFIIKAVNCHEELLELAKWVKESFRPDERPEYVDALIAKAEGK